MQIDSSVHQRELCVCVLICDETERIKSTEALCGFFEYRAMATLHRTVLNNLEQGGKTKVGSLFFLDLMWK